MQMKELNTDYGRIESDIFNIYSAAHSAERSDFLFCFMLF